MVRAGQQEEIQLVGELHSYDQSLYVEDQGRKPQPVSRPNLALIVALIILAVLTGVSISWAFLHDNSTAGDVETAHGAAVLVPLHTPATVSRLAFGSCTAYDLTYQDIWEQGIIPAAPDAWLWLGDMAYLDKPAFDCDTSPNTRQCNCTADWLHQPPYSCLAASPDNAQVKMAAQLAQPGYQRFLEYSCPGFNASGAVAPAGDDPRICPRPVLGVYDDHDYGTNNMDRREPNKQLLKQIYLDALGAKADDLRRSSLRGIHAAYTLNPGSEQAVDLVLLDERWDRAPLPCELRRDWCQQTVLPSSDSGSTDYAWCMDFLITGGDGMTGSCCKADESIFWGWCQQEGSRGDPLWELACDFRSPRFGEAALVVRDGRLVAPNPSNASEVAEDSTFCEVLGRRQRAWLESTLSQSSARVKVIASGSVLFGSSPLDTPGGSQANSSAAARSGDGSWRGRCGGDDWDCYRPAALALMHTLQRHAARAGGCWIVLTGDYHISDIKVVQPGSNQPYSSAYQTEGMVTPLWQVMASGMTNSTATPGASCEGWRTDPAGLRVHGECAFVSLPAFGMLHFDWDHSTVSLQIRGALDGGPVLQEQTINLETCQPV